MQGWITAIDLISRAAAIEYLMTNMNWHDENGYEVDDADDKRAIITDLVNGIPAADAEHVVHDAEHVVHGRWIHHDGGFRDHYDCTACDKDMC